MDTTVTQTDRQTDSNAQEPRKIYTKLIGHFYKSKFYSCIATLKRRDMLTLAVDLFLINNNIYKYTVKCRDS